MLDMKTVVFSYFITNTLITCFIALLWYQNRKRYAGLAFWLIDFILQAVGFLLLLLRDVAPDLVSIVIAQMLIAAGALCIYIGLERFVGKPSSQIHNYLGVIGFVGLMAYFTFVQPDISIRTILVSAVTILLTGQCSWLLLRRAAPSLRPIAREVGVVFLLYALVAFVRIIELILVPLPATSGLFEAPSLQVVFVFINQLLCIALTFTLILMVTRRLELDVRTQAAERTRAEQVLGESEKRFALAFRSSPYAIAITRVADERMIEVNEGFANITGYSAAECIGKTTLELNLWVDEQDRARVVAELVQGNPVSGMELRFRKKDGAIVTGLLSANVFTLGDQPCILSSINDITERKRLEEALRESEERFRVALKHSPIVVFNQDRELRYTWIHNPHPGFSAEAILGKTDAELLPPEDAAPLTEIKRRVLETGSSARVETRTTIKGEPFYYDLTVEPVRDLAGRVTEITCAAIDITERKRAEREIEHLASFPRLNPNPVLEIDASGAVTYQNHAATALLAQTRQDVRIFFPPDLPAILETLAQKRAEVFYRQVEIDHRVFGENIYLVPEFNVARIYTIDITERKQAEELLQARMRLTEFAATHSLEEILQKTLDEISAIVHSPIGFYHFVEADEKTLSLQVWSTRTVQEFCTAQGKGLHYSVDEAGVWVDCVHQRRPVIHNDYASLPHRKGMPEGHASVIRELVVPILRGDRVVAILGVGNKSSDYTEEDVLVVTHLADVAWEIAERKRAAQALRESEERFRAIFEQAAVGVVLVNSITGAYVQLNQKHCDIVGYTREEMLAKTFQDITHPDDLQLDLDQMKLLREGEIRSFAMDKRYFRKDGSIVWVNLTVSPMWPLGEAPNYHIAIVEDITARKRAEAALKEYSERLEQMVDERTRALRDAQEQLLRQERLTMLGQIAGGIGHELRSPLGAIKNAAYLLNLSLKSSDPDIQETLQILKRQVDASDRIIASLLSFARPEPPFRRATDLRETIDAVLNQVTIPENVTVRRQFDNALPVLLVDPAQLQIAFHNLIRNAVQAMPDGGQLTIAARQTSEVLGDFASLEIAFSDTGVGIAPEVLDKIFQPMFTTKTRGMGLGLALCKLLVEAHGGKIKVTSQVGVGTTFVVYLPMA